VALFGKISGRDLTPLLLRASLALAFGYAAISSFQNPADWLGYLPSFIRESENAETLLHVFSVLEMALAVWLLSGKMVRLAALAAFAMLAGVVVSNISLFSITFRDMALMLTALALYFTEWD
jgi:uncharacterized membrane protein YphA (DoxX/SURF4 family)